MIARLRWGHHRVFEHVERRTPALVRTLFAWLFAVVLLSAGTAVSTAVPPTAQIRTFAVYVGVMILAGGLLLAQAVVVLRHPEITDGRDEGALDRVVGSAETLLGFVITVVVGTAFPVVNSFAFFVLVLTGRLDGPIVQRLRRRSDERRPSVR